MSTFTPEQEAELVALEKEEKKLTPPFGSLLIWSWEHKYRKLKDAGDFEGAKNAINTIIIRRRPVSAMWIKVLVVIVIVYIFVSFLISVINGTFKF